MKTKKKTEPSPQAVSGWKKKCDHLVALKKELVDEQDRLEAELAPIRESFEPDIERLRKQVREMETDVVSFGEENFDTLTLGGSEIRTKVSVVTLKKTVGKVTVSDGFSEGEVVEALWKDGKTRKYVNVKKSLDRVGIKKVIDDPKAGVVLGLAGVECVPGLSVTVKGKGD